MLFDQVSVLLVDDDADVRESAQKLLNLAGLPCLTRADAASALADLPPDWPGVIISDVCMPGMDGEALLAALRQRDEQLPVILITGHGNIPMAVRAVRAGAFEFLEKPVSPPQLIDCARRALAQRREAIANRQFHKHELDSRLLGRSAAMRQLRDKLLRLAGTDLSVLICGETGAGRHTVAEQLHRLGRSAAGPLVQLDAEVLEGGNNADQAAFWRARYWDAAQGGTLLVCHPELLPPLLQALLCNWLLEMDPHSPQQRSVRTLAISGGDLVAEVAAGRLRPDLYYALSAATVAIPPLRQRREDIPQLFRHFVQQSCRRLRKPRPEIKKLFLNQLVQADWAGNLRELRNAAEMYAIGLARLEELGRTVAVSDDERTLDQRVESYEKELIESALALFQGKVNATADYLNVPRKKLYLRMKKHNLLKEAFKQPGGAPTEEEG
ncbi:transcriptional regulator [Xenophilus sp. AP218F]|nr:sigma-54 dependent transcriptional regulator [Chromobacterium sp. ASV5]OWY38087.1 transcriptional regulator [Xenophilus sp. AP218F]